MAIKAPPITHDRSVLCPTPVWMDGPHVHNRDGWSPCVQLGWMFPMCKIGVVGTHVYNRNGWSTCVQ